MLVEQAKQASRQQECNMLVGVGLGVGVDAGAGAGAGVGVVVPVVPAWFQLGSSLVPGWFHLAPA